MKHPLGRRTLPALALTATASLALAACGGGSGFDDTEGGGGSDGGAIEVLIGSSGEAETKAVEDAVAAWSADSGVEATVTAAADLPQQLSQGFASGDPADVFYLSTDALGGYVASGALYSYGDQVEGDFYPALTDAFTVDDELVCVPKDFSTLGLVINQTLWDQAGLTEADVPTTWEQLTAVAQQLTTDGVVGLGISPEYQRVGAFFPQAGGAMTNEDGTEATVDSPENLEALSFVQSMLDDGSAAYSSTLGAGWGGEAFGKQLAAMTIEGPWIAGAIANDFPDVQYTVAELPEGPAGKGTLAFTNCWGIAEDSGSKEDAVDLVQYLTAADQQLAFASAFGVIPSIESAAQQYGEAEPELAPFVAGADYAQNPPAQEGAADVITDFNAQLEGLADGDPEQILGSVQDTLQAALDAAN